MPRSRSVASNAAIASISQVAAMISGGALALIVAATIGSNAETDGFFAAFAIYSAIVAFSQSARTTIVARLLEGEERFTAFDRFLGAGLLLAAIAAIAFGPLGPTVANVLTGDLPSAARETAASALLLFVPASALQIFAAFGAAMLGALDDYVWAGVAFVAGSLATIVAFLALRPSLGIDGLAVAIVAGSVLSASIVAIGLLHEGWRPSSRTVREPRRSGRAASVLLISSVSFLIAQVGYLITLSIGGGLGVGIITVYSYAYLAMSLVQALFVSSVPMVMAAPFAQSWDRSAETLLPHHEAVLRAGMMLVVPVLAAAALVGTDVAGFALRQFTEPQIDLVVGLFLILSVNVIWGLVNTVPYAALVGVGRYVALAWVTAVVVVVQIGLVLVAGALDSVWMLAAAVPLSTAVTLGSTLLIISRRYASLAIPRLTAILARSLAAGTIGFGAPWAALHAVGAPAAGWLALASGLLVYGWLATRGVAEHEIGRRLVAASGIETRLGLGSR